MKKIFCYFISCIVMFGRCKNLVYTNEYGTECKTNISAYGFWSNKPIWYFIHECLFRSMKGMHKIRCIYFGEPPRLKLQWSYLQGLYGIIPMHLFCQLPFKSDVYHMMTSSNGNIFRVTGHLCGEFTGPRWIPHTKASDAELWCFLWSTSE